MLDHLKANNRAWAARKIAADAGFFSRLERQQAPEYLWIGCADSRVPPMTLSVSIRANCSFIAMSPISRRRRMRIISRCCNSRSMCSRSSTSWWSGHYGCGGVAAAVDGRRRGLVDHWLHPIREVYHDHREELEALRRPEGAPQPALRTQCDPAGAKCGVRRIPAGSLGARTGNLRPWLGLFAVERSRERSQRDGLRTL